MMGSKVRSLLQWVLFIVVVFRPIYGLRGSASLSLTISPALAANPVNNGKNYGTPAAAPPKEISSHVHHINHSYKKGFSPSIPPSPTKVEEASNTTKAPPISPSHSSGSSPKMSHVPHEGKQPSNITDAPLASHMGLSGSPVISSVPHDIKAPSIAPAPMPHEGNMHPNFTLAPSPSHLHPSESSPEISPAPHGVNNSSNPPPLGSSPSISPARHRVNNSSNPPPSIIPTPPEAKEPLNITYSPLPSHTVPSESSPATSPTPPEVKEPSNSTHPDIPPHSLSPGSHPVMSPVPHEVMNPSNNSRAPKLPVSYPTISPMPHKVKGPTQTSHSPLPSHDFPSEPSPATSPASHEVTSPSNKTQAPLASPPKPSGSYPPTSPRAHEAHEPSNITHSSLPSHPLPPGSSPANSPRPHEAKNPAITHPPSASEPKPLIISPGISHTPHGVKGDSNSTHYPLPSHHPPEFSPAHAPSHGGEDLPGITHSPSASHPTPTVSSPAMSPTRHEFNESSNGRISPLPSHPPPPQSPTVISPAPHKDGPSNITHSPLPSHPHPSDFSPAASPVPIVKDQSNTTNAPLDSHPHSAVSSPLLGPMPHKVKNFSNVAHSPMPSQTHPPSEMTQNPASAPTSPKQGTRTGMGNPAFAPLSSYPPSSHHLGPVVSPAPSHISAVSPSNKQWKHASSPNIEGPSISPIQAPSHPPVMVPKNSQSNHAPSTSPQASSASPVQAPFPPENRDVAHSPSPSVSPSHHNKWPIHPPILPPVFPRMAKAPTPMPVWAFPPPPPNTDCKPLSCQEPLTYPPPGSLCVCVKPIKVGLRLGVALYTFFPLVSELAQEIASGIFVKQSQVRIMGANAATEDSEKTTVLIDVVPLGRSFDMNTALLIFERFWRKQVLIKASYFGDYDVLYVVYPGLPPSPPMAPGVSVDGGAFANGENARTIKPLGVDVRNRKGKEKLSGSIIAIIVLSSVMALVISVGAAWFLLSKRRRCSSQAPPMSQQPPSPYAKPAGTGPGTLGSGPGSTSASYASSIAAAGSAKTFSLVEMERATDRFSTSRVIGEGGFGRVYQGTLEDGTMVAVKVLKRDDHQGGREFLAEVEMLSRLHHRNLVKLIGICTEENVRCLVYELIPNGSVESHLHGLDKDTAPLDWNARMKVALGAARGLAYLHEDSSPRVIHRDFKSSNILLEHDFTPKVSDFGLARAALDEGNELISTRVMGTFGYVAPEYAMTGHLLVKSDVYSYGVVLLELLTGRKPVDMSQPPGQENLVSWARPLLTSMDGLEKLIDPALGSSVSLDSVAKVAAIASMCVQPEVSHRPFMGEVVQALKLVCDEGGEHRISFSQDESSTKESDIITGSGVEERVLSESDIFCASAAFAEDESGSFRRHSSSGPLRTGRSQNFWERARGFSSGSMIENRRAHMEGGDCRP